MKSELDDPRRRLLIEALSVGLFSTIPSGAAWAQTFFGTFGARPEKLPPAQSIYRIAGDVKINDDPANLQSRILPGDTVRTGANSEVIFVVGGNSMIVRADSQLVISGDRRDESNLIVNGLRLITGKLLSVSRNRQMRVDTTVATIGIRGTGFYLESNPEETYFCTCYGVTDVESSKDPSSRETIAAKQHDRPVYILANEPAGRNIRNAPFINHTDQELALIETLVGRTPPFVFPKDAYTAPRRSY